MPKRTDLQSILVVGSGPIVIGQACEFDYSGTQRERGIWVAGGAYPLAAKGFKATPPPQIPRSRSE